MKRAVLFKGISQPTFKFQIQIFGEDIYIHFE